MSVPDELLADAVDAWHDAGDVLLDDRLRAVIAVVRAKVAEDLRRTAKGRRHYAESWPAGPERDYLNSEAEALESAARVAEGDRRTMCALLPVVMWTDAEHEIARGES